jgi:four helix bundle protein
MSQIERFEELVAWQRARELHRDVWPLCREFERSRCHALADQLQRAALSVMSNIAEGFERDGHAEFKQFLTIAKGSCGETRSLLYAALDAELIDEATFRRLLAQAERTSKVIAGLRSVVDGWQKQQRAKTRPATTDAA